MVKPTRPSSTAPDAVTTVVPPPPRPLASMLLNLGRHALPLAFLYWRGNVGSYLLLTAFDLSLGLMLIVSTTREVKDPTTVDPRSRWLVLRLAAVLILAMFYAIVAAIVAMPIFLPAFFLSRSAQLDWWALMSHRTFWVPLAAMALLAALEGQAWFESTTTPGAFGAPTRNAPVIGNLQEDRQRSLAANAAQVTLIGTFVALCFILLDFGRWGFYAFPIIYTAILVFYDARPDISQRIFPTEWRTK